MRLQKELMRFKGGKIVITTKPTTMLKFLGHRPPSFVEEWMKGELEVGEITLFEDRAVIAFKKEVEEKT
jgi:putative transposase